MQQLHPDHLRIARAGVWLLLLTLVAKLAGAAKEVAIAWRYGRGPEVDAYNLALTLSTWLPATLVAVMTVVVVPALVRLRSTKADERQGFLRELNGLGISIGLVLTVCVWLTVPWSMQSFAPALPQGTRRLAAEMLLGLAPLALLTILVGIFTTRLQSAHDHSYAIAEGVPSIILLLLLLAWNAPSVMPLVAGTVAGFALQAWWLGRRVARGEGQAIAFALRPRAAGWTDLWRSAAVIGAGQLLLSFSYPVDQWFAATVGPGSNATLGYASRILAIGMTLGAAVISRATLPVFSEGVASGHSQRSNRHALRWSVLMLVVGAFAAALVALLAPWIIATLFERGAFTAEDTEAVSRAVRFGAWQMPPYLSGLVLVSVLASQRRYDVITAAAAVSIVVKMLGNLVLADSFGVAGLMLATAAMYTSSAALCWLGVSRIMVRDGAAGPRQSN